jgi:hypothetical protein
MKRACSLTCSQEPIRELHFEVLQVVTLSLEFQLCVNFKSGIRELSRFHISTTGYVNRSRPLPSTSFSLLSQSSYHSAVQAMRVEKREPVLGSCIEVVINTPFDWNCAGSDVHQTVVRHRVSTYINKSVNEIGSLVRFLKLS